MSKRKRNARKRAGTPKAAEKTGADRHPDAIEQARKRVREPVSEVDGIPDRSSNAAAWKYILLAVIFLGWVAALIYFQVGGNP